MTLDDLVFTPDGRETLRDLLFTFDGRIERRKFWLAALVWILIPIAIWAALVLVGWLSSLAWIAGVAVVFVAGALSILSAIAVGIKRLHDRGKSGRWLLPFYLGPAIIGTIGGATGSIRIASLISTAISVWAVVELGCLPGTAGPNRYGPDPLAASDAGSAST
ncbi:DUF805 domain-containing protein [Bradyrhizobium sp. Ce-3]|uniref:DUF805 domain-containing protein n=1 Tax=Bradyrhizobium sp. Ce-3 TaxID=2913970 RepID=UPI001FC8CA66|nr:DUF805 domain-containing protein [Bradyrhizobium sp. Ce-3]GKQ51616.1 hypothetical protein BRSPCE3_24710 [Bradyrhizobium sp. Ce-3]